jgi:hypothetical protein
MANKFQVKRTTVSGRTPNTTNSSNSRFVDTGELALNLPDGKLFSSNGSVYFEVGANLINSSITSTLTVSGSGGNAVHSNSGITLTDTSGKEAYLGATYTSLGGTSSYPNTIMFQQTANPGLPEMLMTRGDLTTTNTSYKSNQILMQSAVSGGNTKNVAISTTGILQQANVGLDTYADYYTTFQGARWRGANISGQIFLTSDQSLMSPAATNQIAFVVSGNTSGNVALDVQTDLKISRGLIANGGYGAAGQVLTTNGSSAYWSTVNGSINTSSVTTGSLQANSIAITSGTLTVGNSTVNTDIGNNYISVGNTTSFINVYSSYIKIGNTTVNATINSTFFTATSNNTSFVGSVSAANVVSNAQLSANLASYAALSGATFTGPVSVASSNLTVKGIIANGSLGTNGQILASNGTSVYWTADQGSVNATTVSTQTLSANAISISSGTLTVGNSTVNTDIGNNYVSVGNTTSFINVYSSYIQIGNTVANATINSTTYTGTSNNTSFVGTVSAANVVSNAQLSANLANYQTTAGLSANVATLTANNTSFVGTVSAANVVSNAQLSANLANYQTTAGLSANVATLTANNTSFVGTVSAANVVSNAQLSGNLASYAALSGATFTGPVSVASSNLTVKSVVANGSLGSAGQVLASGGSAGNTYWVTVSSGGSVNTDARYTFANVITFNSNVVVNGALVANGSVGTNGQILVSNGSTVYWATDTSTGNVTANTITSQNVTANSVTSQNVSANSISANIISSENLTINQGISVGNTTVNTSINATAIFSGNTTSNSLVSPTKITAANTTSNSTIDPSTIFVGNSVTNAVVSINQIDTIVSNIVSFQVGYNSGGALLINTPTAHGLSNATLDYFGSSVAVASNTHPWIDGILFNYAPLYTSSNTIGYTWDSSKVPNNALKIASLVRTAGNVVLTTVGPHFANTSVFPSGFQSKFTGISAPPVGIINSNSVQLLNVINTTAFWYNVSSAPYKALTIDQISVVGGVYPYSGPVSAPVMISSSPNAVVTSSGMVVFFVRTTTAHGLSNGSAVTIQGITNSPIRVGTVEVSWNGTYKAWTTHSLANSTYFGLIAFPKSSTLRSVPTLVSATSPTGTPLAVQNGDVSYTPPVPAYIVPLTGTITATGPNASVKQTDPVILQVANNDTRVRITPRNIFVGNTSGGTYTLLSQSGVVAAKRGSYLASSVNGDGIKVESLVDDLSTADADATFFFANATVSQVGNSTVGSVITSNTISTSKFITTSLDNDTINTTMTPDGITINITEDTTSVNTYIAAKSASFAGSAEIAGALILGSTVLANGSAGEAGQILTSSNTGNVYWSTATGGTGAGVDFHPFMLAGM